MKRKTIITKRRYIRSGLPIIDVQKERSICNATGKICYSRRDSGSLVNDFRKGHNKRFGGHVPLRAYFCVDCGCWHTTHLRK